MPIARGAVAGDDARRRTVRSSVSLLTGNSSRRAVAWPPVGSTPNIAHRYGRSATIVTSQLPVDRRHELIGDPTLANAILDRLVHNANRLDLAGESMRKIGTRHKILDRDLNP